MPADEATAKPVEPDFYDPIAEDEAAEATVAFDQGADDLAERPQDAQDGQPETGTAPTPTGAPSVDDLARALDEAAAMSTREERIARLEAAGYSREQATAQEPHLLLNADYTRKLQKVADDRRDVEAKMARLDELLEQLAAGQDAPQTPADEPPPGMNQERFIPWWQAKHGVMPTTADWSEYLAVQERRERAAELDKRLKPLEQQVQMATEQQREARFEAQFAELRAKYPDVGEIEKEGLRQMILKETQDPVNPGFVENVFHYAYGAQRIAALQVENARLRQQLASGQEPSVVPSSGGPELDESIPTSPSADNSLDGVFKRAAARILAGRK